MKKIITTKGTEFEQNYKDLVMIETAERGGLPTMLSSEELNEGFSNAEQDVRDKIGFDVNGEEITITPTTSQQVITPSAGKNAILKATVNPVELQDKSVNPTTESQAITSDEGYIGLSSVTVNAVDSTIDNNIRASNIKKDVTILGVTGSYESGEKYAPRYLNLPNGALFYKCPLSDMSYEIDNLDVTNITNFTSFLRECKNVTSLDVSGWNVSNGTKFTAMFGGGLTEPLPILSQINVSNWNTQSATDMESMFNRLPNLQTIDLSSFNTSNVTTMDSMFYKDTGLVSADLSSFTAKSGVNISGMFHTCTSLRHLDMRNFNFTLVGSYTNVFGQDVSSYIPADCEIIVKDATQKQWFNTNFSRLTNVKTVAEYEG